MKYCIDCKHLSGDLCKASEIPRHMVTGQVQTWTAIHCRSLPISGCGEIAKWFEPFEFEPINEQDADLDDLSAIPFGR